jgi:hypothetical protein
MDSGDDSEILVQIFFFILSASVAVFCKIAAINFVLHFIFSIM